VQKPDQRERFYKNPSNDELLDAIEEAKSSIVSAMESLRGYEDFADWFNALGDMVDEMQPEHERYESIAAAEYEAEMEALTRDYYRSVI